MIHFQLRIDVGVWTFRNGHLLHPITLKNKEKGDATIEVRCIFCKRLEWEIFG